MARRLRAPFLLVLWTAMGSVLVSAARGVDQTTPPPSYYAAFTLLYDGEYQDALRAFQSESRGSIKTSQSRWIDSICYEAMCGECYYQMGVLDQALAHYSNALELFTRFSDWMAKVQFSPTIAAASAGARKAVPWGASTRPSRLGRYRDSELIAQSQTGIASSGKQTLLMKQANLFPITPQEIVRCTALAMRRRAELLGPVSPPDPLTNSVAAATSGAIGPPNHWSNAWIDLERGLALAADGKDSQAVGFLNRAVVAGGEFDHPMTCVARGAERRPVAPLDGQRAVRGSHEIIPRPEVSLGGRDGGDDPGDRR